MTITLNPLPFGSEYSMKNIPTPHKKEYQCKSFIQGGKFINNLRWRVWHHLKRNETPFNANNDQSLNIANTSALFTDQKETFGFKSGKAGPMIPELQEFEKKFWAILKDVKFFNRSNPLQEKLHENLNQLKELNKVVVFADKSNNLYCISPADYE